ncbi:PD-(D/E)XK nuclease family protein [Pontibacter sp. HSC-14F20]|uniref:PDDEXK-like family protein n=1 Tax=Pontibacter sp. HSC-14F20 TaxID=2864136 RepID=UPI001C739934|nr:PD-(D/E)XK nuclease family protein [Pontibacter sp. HSC-14F20]MBX0335178.1 PD-(D/E)XK nuclease family protein [Pontibacter sp. HSC-14F20]
MDVLNELELQKAYLKLVRDPEVDKLELALNKPNIFSILSIGHMEIRHSNFLGWLLDPKESHGLNDMFLKRFLREIFFDGKIEGLYPIDAERLNYQNVEIRREWRNIDLFIKFSDLIICIENKIWSKDHSEQLSRYKAIVHEEYPDTKIKKVFVYLTPYGGASSHEQDTYAFISYQHIIQILDRILSVYKDFIAPQSSYYIQDYIKSLKRNLMGSDVTNDMAREIYLNHKKLLDFIFENKPDHTDEFTNLLGSYLRNNGYSLGSTAKHYVRFLPNALNPLVPRYKKVKSGWAKKEAFQFEFQLDKDKLIFKATGAPSGPNSAYKEKLTEIMNGVDGVRGNQDKSWQSFFREEVKMDIEELMRNDPKTRPAEFQTFWNGKVYPIIEKVKGAMLAHKEELMALKQEVEQ